MHIQDRKWAHCGSDIWLAELMMLSSCPCETSYLFQVGWHSSTSGEWCQEALKLCQEVTVNQKKTCQLCSSKCGRVEHSQKWPRIPRGIFREKWEQSDAIIQHVGLCRIETKILRDIPRRIYRCLRERGNPTRRIIQMTCGNAS